VNEVWPLSHDNGKAVAAIKSAKNMIKRTVSQHQDEYLALLELRNTPRQAVCKSPVEIIMFFRVTRFLFPTLPKPCHNENQNKRRERFTVKNYCHKWARPLQPVCVGYYIMFQSPNKQRWQKALIVRKLGTRMYIIRSSQGVL